MLNSNRFAAFLVMFALIVFILSIPASNAAEVNQTQIDDLSVEKDLVPLEGESKIIKDKTYENENIKKDGQLQQAQLTAHDVECHVNDVVTIGVNTIPDGIYDGVLIYSVDDEVIGANNLSVASPSIEFDSYGYDVGEHIFRVDLTSSTTYEPTYTTSTINILKLDTSIDGVEVGYDADNTLKLSCNVISGVTILNFGEFNVYYGDELIASKTINTNSIDLNLENKYNYEVLKLEYIGNDVYNDSYIYYLINVDKRDCNIYTQSLTAFHGDIAESNIVISSNSLVNDGVMYLYVDDVLIDVYYVTSNNVGYSIDLQNYLEGNYSIRIVYTDSNVYRQSEYTTYLRVKKVNTVTYTSNISTYRNQVVNLRAYVYNYVDVTSDGLVEFFVDDESILTKLLTDNSVYEDYLVPDSLDYGVHNLSVVYYGSDRYQNSSALSSFTVNKYSNRVYLKDYSLTDSGLINLTVNLYSYNNTVDDGVVNCFIDGKLVLSENVTGNQCNLVLPASYVPGRDYDVLLSYVDSDFFADSNYTTTIHPDKHNITLRISKYLSTNDILNITTYVYSDDYSNITGGTLEYYLNDELIGISTITDNTANMEYDMSDKAPGNYTLKVNYNTTPTNNEATNTTTIEKTIKQKTIYIQAPNTIQTTPEQTITIEANLTDYELNPVTQTIQATITYDNQTTTAQFQNGRLTFNINTTKTGQQTLQITTENTTQYKQTSKNITIKTEKISTYIQSPNTIRATKLEEVTINATINAKQVITDPIPAIIRITNQTVYQGFFNNTTLQYTLKLGDKYTQDQYNITIISPSTNKYQEATKNITLQLNKRNTYIKSQNIYSHKTEKITINATVYDSLTQKEITHPTQVAIKINNVTIAHTTTDKGQILYQYTNNLNNPNYNITIKVGESSIYKQSEWNGELINTKSSIKISSQNIYAKANSTINIKANILKDDKPINETIQVAIKINNLTIAVVNATKGKIEYTYKLPDNLGKKEYNITFITGETQRYTPATANTKLILSKNYQEIIAENITSNPNKTITIKAKLVDKDGKLITSTAKINIKIAGITITDTNITGGIINYNHTLSNLKQGYYDILVQTGETYNYLHATAHSQLKIE
ncbi:MAG: hypothetical protein BZ136_05680 [Methanosphaera sp. rholeuAM74]|nr:MAG: hypothetical protein BZ136_05680 [Methanosphaera sp. rholeuAM74]